MVGSVHDTTPGGHIIDDPKEDHWHCFFMEKDDAKPAKAMVDKDGAYLRSDEDRFARQDDE